MEQVVELVRLISNWLRVPIQVGPIIAVGDQGMPVVQKLFSPEDRIIDYYNGYKRAIEEIKAAIKGEKLEQPLSVVSDKGSLQTASHTIDGCYTASILPSRDYSVIPSIINQSQIWIGLVYGEQSDLGQAGYGLLAKFC